METVREKVYFIEKKDGELLKVKQIMSREKQYKKYPTANMH